MIISSVSIALMGGKAEPQTADEIRAVNAPGADQL